jgi:pimeloyl-ACP methyl ester carboxylesterase
MSANPALQKMRLSNGIDLAFQTAGDSNQTALVLLHGLPNSSRNFRDVIEPLSRSAFIVAPDLPGFGASDVLPKAIPA